MARVRGTTGSRQPKAADKLADYRRKRDPRSPPSPSPTGAKPTPRPRAPRAVVARAARAPIFVIQEHHARALHWDFRLEHDGVLVSWAIPKGLPSTRRPTTWPCTPRTTPWSTPASRERSPRASTAGAEVILWDHGTYDEIKWSDREVMVVLHGERVQGTYVLFATEGRAARRQGRGKVGILDGAPYGRRPGRVRAIRRATSGPCSPPRAPCPRTTTPGPTSSNGTGSGPSSYVDGGRIHDRVPQRQRPDAVLPRAPRPGRAAGLAPGRPRRRDRRLRRRPAALGSRAAAPHPCRGRHTRPSDWRLNSPSSTCSSTSSTSTAPRSWPRPYAERRRRLEGLGLVTKNDRALDAEPAVRRARAPTSCGPARTRVSRGSWPSASTRPYLPGKRSPTWTKVKNVLHPGGRHRRLDTGRGQPPGPFGLAAARHPLRARGFSTSARSAPASPRRFSRISPPRLDALAIRPQPLRHRGSPSLLPTWPRGSEPTLVGEVSFGEWTTDGRMRHPSWRGLRDDKTPDEVRRES